MLVRIALQQVKCSRPGEGLSIHDVTWSFAAGGVKYAFLATRLFVAYEVFGDGKERQMASFVQAEADKCSEVYILSIP